MNGFADRTLDEGAFGEKKGFSEGLRTFDAFRMSFPSRLRFRCVHSRVTPYQIHLLNDLDAQAPSYQPSPPSVRPANDPFS